MRPVVVLGDPAEDRVQSFARALVARGWPSPRVVDPALEDATFERGSFVRIESPGRAEATERLMLARGATAAWAEGSPCVPPDAAPHVPLPRGRLGWPRQWFLGFVDTLRRVEHALAQSGSTASIEPAAVVRAFDKLETRTLLQTVGIPIPPAVDDVRDYADLRLRMTQEGHARVFVKLRHGSSGAGVVALRVSRMGVQAFTTTVLDAGQAWNTRQIRKLSSEREIAAVIGTLIPHHVVVERWIPKAGAGRSCFDLRFVAIAGECRHAVLRWSSTPITNLHLGNRREDAAWLRMRLGEPAWTALEHTVRETAAAFGRPLHLGIDVALATGLRRHAVLEVNAFGDFVKDVRHDGETPHEAEVRVLAEGWPGLAVST